MTAQGYPKPKPAGAELLVNFPAGMSVHLDDLTRPAECVPDMAYFNLFRFLIWVPAEQK